jgi:hypothetical protein
MPANRIVQGLLFLCILGLGAETVWPQVSVLTQHNDIGRTGQNLGETILTPSNVNVNQFGLLFKLPVDDQVYAQPLYVADVTIGGGTHNVVYVATVNNSVYAFNADYPGPSYWQVNLGPPQNASDTSLPCENIAGHVGIVGTPVIDGAAGTLYVVAATKDNGVFHQKLHALDIATGNERPSSPVIVAASGFDALQQNQRAALLLLNGVVYIAFGAHCDVLAYHGFLFGYSASNLSQVAVFNTSPNTGGAGIWQSGQGPAADSNNNLYVVTGNGSWNGTTEFSESFLKLSTSSGLTSGLTLTDWFTPSNYALLDLHDFDLGVSGAMLIPGTNLAMNVGKQGILYLINTGNMGHLGDSNAVEHFQATTDQLHGSAVYWNSSRNGPLIYMWAQTDTLRAYQFVDGALQTTPFANGTYTIGGNPGAYLSVSANGGSNGLIWANALASGDANNLTQQGILRVFDADQIGTEVYNSGQNSSRDGCGNFAKNGYPTVANGKVYLGSFGTAYSGSGQLCVYGLFSSHPPPAAPANLTAAASVSGVKLSWSASNGAISYNVKQAAAIGGPYTVVAGGLTPTSYNLTSTSGSTYYEVSAVNTGGEGVNSAAAQSAYLVADIVPYASDSIGNFGDGQINTLDLLAVLRAVAHVPGSVPACGSDRFDALDAFPVDSGSQRGGDGVLNTLDLLVVLRRATNVDSSRPLRTSQAKSCSVMTTQAKLRPNPEGALQLGVAESTSDGIWSTPVYLHSTIAMSLSGLAFSAGYDAVGTGAQVSFVSGQTNLPSIVDDDLPAKISAAWLDGLSARAGETLLLGYIRSTTAQPPKFFGVSANAIGTGRTVYLRFQ